MSILLRPGRPVERWLAGVCLAFALMTPRCGGTETGNPSAVQSVSIALVLRATGSGDAGAGDAGAGSVRAEEREREDGEEEEGSPRPYSSIESAWVATESLKLKACVGTGEAGLPPLIWDLTHPTGHTARTEISNFCGVVLRTQPADASMAKIPSQMAGASLFIGAHRNDATPVEVTAVAKLDVTHASPTPLSDSKLTYVFDAAAWFRGMDLDALNPDSDGVIRISPTSNPALLELLEGQIADGSVLRSREVDDDAFDD